MKKKDSIEKARQYVEKAKKILEKNGKFYEATETYQNNKCVKRAGNRLWKACLIALEAAFPNVEGEGRILVDKYKEVAQCDKKLHDCIFNTYYITYLAMGYDGTSVKTITDVGFEYANLLIDHCAILSNQQKI